MKCGGVAWSHTCLHTWHVVSWFLYIYPIMLGVWRGQLGAHAFFIPKWLQNFQPGDWFALDGMAAWSKSVLKYLNRFFFLLVIFFSSLNQIMETEILITYILNHKHKKYSQFSFFPRMSFMHRFVSDCFIWQQISVVFYPTHNYWRIDKF